MTAMVKDGTTEYLYDAGKLVKTETGKNEKIANTSDIMTVGIYGERSPRVFQRRHLRNFDLRPRAVRGGDCPAAGVYDAEGLSERSESCAGQCVGDSE